MYDFRLASRESLRTVAGYLSKGWYIGSDGATYLVKGGSICDDGTTHYEPYSEYIAYIVARELGIPCAPVMLMESDIFPDVECLLPHVSLCKRIIDPVGSQRLSAASLMRTKFGKEYRKNYLESYKNLGIDLSTSFKMFLLDAIIGNDDRHLNNWDFVISGDIIQASPLFDNGSSLLAMFTDSEIMHNLNYDDAKPFAHTHKQQMQLAKPWGTLSYDFNTAWFGIRSEIEDVLRFLSQERRYAIHRYLYTRLEYYSVTGGFYAHNE